MCLCACHFCFSFLIGFLAHGLQASVEHVDASQATAIIGTSKMEGAVADLDGNFYFCNMQAEGLRRSPRKEAQPEGRVAPRIPESGYGLTCDYLLIYQHV